MNNCSAVLHADSGGRFSCFTNSRPTCSPTSCSCANTRDGVTTVVVVGRDDGVDGVLVGASDTLVSVTVASIDNGDSARDAVCAG